MSVLIPSRGFSSPKRLARMLFDWDARDQSLVARSGQQGVFARAGGALALDSAGRFRPVAHSQPRWISVMGNDGVRVVAMLNEPTGTNLVEQNCTCATTPWAFGGTVPTNNAGIFAGLSFCLFANANASVANQPITFTGDGIKGYRFYVRHNGATGTAFILPVHDTTANVTKADVQCTLNADGTISFVAIVGNLIKTTRLADGVYEVIGQSDPVTAAHSHVTYANDGSGAGGTATSFLGTCFDVQDALISSSPIVTTTTTLTRATETLSWPAAFRPQALTLYTKFIELSPLQSGDAQRLFGIGNNGVSIADLVRVDGFVEFEAGGLDGDNAVGIAEPGIVYGDVVEVCGSWQADGTTLPSGATLSNALCVNGGLITPATTTGNTRLPATWSDPVIWLNKLDGSAEDSQRPHAFLSARVAAGVRSLGAMRRFP